MRALFVLVFLVGCGPALDEPAYPAPSAFNDLPVPESAPPNDAPPPAPRLRHTKTLGQSEGTYDRGPGPAPAQAGGPSTTVVVNNNIVQQASPTVIVTGPGFTGASPVQGASRGGSGARGGGTTGGAPPVGGDWPQVPSYGPR